MDTRYAAPGARGPNPLTIRRAYNNMPSTHILTACALASACALVWCAPEGMAQSPPPPTFWAVTDRGNLFEIKPPDEVPTTDVVSSPYIEFQRVGGLVANGDRVAEAGQYNHVGSGPTYIVDNWADGTTYGIPNGAPLEGPLRLSPAPHLHLRDLAVHVPPAIDRVEMIDGGLTHTVHNHTTRGTYHEFTGNGRAILWLDPAHNYYALNLVCLHCQTDTPAAVGSVPDDGTGDPESTGLGTNPLAGGPSIACTVDGVNHTGCGLFAPDTITREWPLNPRPRIGGGAPDAPPIPEPEPILHVTRYDTASCPGADRTNTEAERLNHELFRLVSEGCIHQSYEYEWWDGSVEMESALPLRPGLSVWPKATGHPAVVLNLRGSHMELQAFGAPDRHTAESILDDTFSVDPGPVVGAGSLVILHDAFTHLGAYTRSTLAGMADHIQTFPQLRPSGSVDMLAHARTPGAVGLGGLLGAACKDSYQYCMTVFDRGPLPVVNNAAGVVYDPRNGAELNRGGMVDNHGSVFGTGSPGMVPYDSATLNLIQAYAVVPVTGSLSVKELYVVAHPGDCSTYVDRSTTPHRWAAPSGPGWLGLKYLEGDYGADDTLIDIPLLPGYGVACMRTHGSDEFRQFTLDNFFVIGAHASFGGTRYVSSYASADFPPHTAGRPLPTEPDVAGVRVLHTDVVLPGEGVGVLDLDLDMAGSVAITGVAAGRGGVHAGTAAGSCDWHLLPTPRSTAPRSNPWVSMTVYVQIEVPTAGGYVTLDRMSASHTTRLAAATAPTTIGEDCRHVSYAEFDFDPEFRTIPLEYASNAPVRITITADVDFAHGSPPQYAGRLPVETMHVEVVIDRLSMKAH